MKSKVINLTVSAQMFERLVPIAESNYCSIQEIIRKAIVDYIKTYDDE